MTKLFAIALLVASTFQIRFGSCPTPSGIASFNVNNFLGVWYIVREQKGYPYNTRDCPQAKYTLRTDGKVTALNSDYNIGKDKLVDTTGTIEFTDGSKGTIKKSLWLITGNFQVLDTDYTNYLIIYSCSSAWSLFNFQWAWILTRTKNPPAATIDTYFQKLKDKVDWFSADDFKDPQQGGSCKYIS